MADNPVFTISRTVNAPRDLVFRAHTEEQQLRQWWGPKGLKMIECKIDLRPGGMFLYGMKQPDGGMMWGRWIFREISPPDRLVYVVSFSDPNGEQTRHPMAPDWPMEMLNTTTFTEQGGKTTISLTFEPLNASAKEREVFAANFDSMNQGFGGTYDQFDAYLAQICKPQTVIPYLTIRGAAKAIEWYAKVFGATEQMRLPAEDGKRLMHAALALNGGTVFMSDEFVEYDGGSAPKEGQIPPIAIALNFEAPGDVDATFKRAVAEGASGITEPRDEFWGARFAVVGDPFGHRWLLNAALTKG